MPRFFTRAGDNGTTSLLGEQHIPKNHPRLETVGDVDEATAALGLARANSQLATTREILLAVQRDLYHLMAEVAATPKNATRFRAVDAARVSWLEEQISALEEQVQIPGEFIVPGDTTAGAALDVARTVVRRAERQLSALVLAGEVENQELLRYLNRLSSLCFALELFENQAAGRNQPTWAKPPQESTQT